MLKALNTRRGIVTGPHHLASQAGLAVLREGGNAVEAMVAAAATIAVVYPHMNGIGGDGFWLIAEPGRRPTASTPAAGAARRATRFLRDSEGSRRFRRAGRSPQTRSPAPISAGDGARRAQRRGGQAAAGAPARGSRSRYAERRHAGTRQPARRTRAGSRDAGDAARLRRRVPAEAAAPAAGLASCMPPALAATLRRSRRAGSPISTRRARAVDRGDLAALGSPLTSRTISQRHRRAAGRRRSRSSSPSGTVYNLPPPTQGAASLMILGHPRPARARRRSRRGCDYVHLVVEATKQAFLVRDSTITDPADMTVDAAALLDAGARALRGSDRSRHGALPWRAADRRRRHGLDGRDRRQAAARSASSRASITSSAAASCCRGQRHHLAEPRLQLLARPERRQSRCARPQAVSHAESRAGALSTTAALWSTARWAATASRRRRRRCSRATRVRPARSRRSTAPRWLLGRTWGRDHDISKLGRWLLHQRRLVAALRPAPATRRRRRARTRSDVARPRWRHRLGQPGRHARPARATPAPTAPWPRSDAASVDREAAHARFHGTHRVRVSPPWRARFQRRARR